MTDQQLLARAIELAAKSAEPVGCGTLITSHGKVVAEEYNSQRADNLAISHAEIKAVIAASKATGRRKIPQAVAYCSCEPCAMCLTALSYAGVQRIVYGKSMSELFPHDPQSQTDPYAFVKSLNFVPRLEKIEM